MDFGGGLYKGHLGKDRIEFLADGVFAIVMTLLVLELKVPELPRHAPAIDLLRELAHLGPVFFSYLVTFLLSGSYWLLHTLCMEHVRRADHKLYLIGLGFLFFVALFPFSAALLGHYLMNSAAQTVYFLNQCGAASMLLLKWKHANSARLVDEVPPDVSTRLSTQLRGLALGTLAGVAAAWIAPQQSFLYSVLVILGNRGLSRRLARKAPRPETKPSAAAAHPDRD